MHSIIKIFSAQSGLLGPASSATKLDRRNKVIRLSRAFVGEEEITELRRVFFESIHFGMGSHVEAFEKAIQQFLEADVEVVGVNSGTAALHLAVAAPRFPKGSEVIVPSLTFAACHSAVMMAGHVPISCDVQFPSGHIDLEDAEKRISRKTVAVMPVAYSGTDFDRAGVYQFAEKHGLRVIEDDAHAFGSTNQHRVKFGASGDIVCFSFDGIKNITCGEGGAVVTRDKALARQVRILRGLGIEPDVDLRYKGQRAWEFNIEQLGYRYHMSNINAAIGLAQLKRLPSFKEKKKQLYQTYVDCFRELGLENSIQLTQSPKDSDILHIFPVLLPKGVERAPVRAHLKEAGIESGFHYAPNHLHTLFKTEYSLPNAEELGLRLLSLPFHAGLEIEDVRKVANALQSAVKLAS